MSYAKSQGDATSTSGSTIFTPYTSSHGDSATVNGELWDGRCYAVPWPGETYIILEKDTGRAITLANGRLRLQEIQDDGNTQCHWLCVEANGYFGFLNVKSGRYLGHNGEWNMRASASVLQDWEYFTPRRHPKGGYQLLTPYYHHTLRGMTVANDGVSLVRKQHGATLWEFVKV
ncbi:hypothetical protein PT974_06911 [Cladobotryum mycophilum]|uniref:Ricin B lectin domain-containing protein n=1 Tax=Cladobotryum mycophilum TaxID=491253 RepID=A0ABR0SNY1_9HYPO